MSFLSKSHGFLVHLAARILGMHVELDAIPTANDSPDPSMGVLWFASHISRSVERDHRFISTVNIFPPMAGSSDALLSSHPYTVAHFSTIKSLNTPLKPSVPESSGVEHEALLFRLVRVNHGIDPQIWVGMHRAGRGAPMPRVEPAPGRSVPSIVIDSLSSESRSSGPYEPAKDRVVFNSSRKGALEALGSDDTEWFETRAYSYESTLPPSSWPGPFENPPYIGGGVGFAPTVLHVLALGFTYSRALPQYDLLKSNCYSFADAITHCLVTTFPTCQLIPGKQLGGTFKGRPVVQRRHNEMWEALPRTFDFVAKLPLQIHTQHLREERDAAEEERDTAKEAQAIVEAKLAARDAEFAAQLAAKDAAFLAQAQQLEGWKRRALANEAVAHDTVAMANSQVE